MWIVKTGNLAFNLEMCDEVFVQGDKLFFTYLNEELLTREYQYETKEHAVQDYNHIINAMKRKEHVLYL